MQNRKGNTNLAGIVPVAGYKVEDFKFPWHDCLMPLNKNYLAVEHSVMQCADAGCKIVWVVCNDDMQPLIRHRLGDRVRDRHSITRTKWVKDRPIREVPIMYVPIHPNDRNKRDCLAWSVAYGADQADRISHGISSWLRPTRFFVSWPFGVTSDMDAIVHRSRINVEDNIMFTHKGKTVCDGEFLPFSFSREDMRRFKKDIRERGTGLRTLESRDGNKPYYHELPEEEQYSARFFSHDEIFNIDEIAPARMIEVDWYHNISTWDGYSKFIGSKEARHLNQTPPERVRSYYEYGPVGIDVEDDPDIP